MLVRRLTRIRGIGRMRMRRIRIRRRWMRWRRWRVIVRLGVYWTGRT